MYRELLVDPDAFFRERAADPSFRGPVVVVLLVAVIGILGSIPVLRLTTAALPAQAGPFVPVIAAIGVVGGLVGVLVSWLLYAAAFHVISAVVFGASGRFRTTFALVGWGFVPSIPQAVISAAVTAVVFTGATLPSDPNRLQGTIQGLRHEPLFVVASVLGIAFLAWRAVLWTFAVRYARSLTLREAALTIVLPVLVALALALLGLLGVF